MRLTHSRWPITARKGFGLPTQHNRYYLGVTRPSSRLGGADMGAVVQGRDTETGAQGVPVDGDGQVRWFPSGAGALFGGAGQPADLQQGLGVALRG